MKASQSFVNEATNRLVEGTNWKGDTSAYTYNGLGLRVNNLVTTHAGQTYERDYVIDYTSPENDDLYVYALGNGQLEYEQRHVYAGSERIEQITERGTGSWERTLYVHEDVMGNTRYYTKTTGQNFAELQYDAWGQPVSPNKLVNNDHGNYVFATFTGHIYDTTLDIYFAEARFYDATNRTWMAMDPIKDGLNWYQYCLSNPTTNWDPTGLFVAEVASLAAANPYALVALIIVGGAFARLPQETKDQINAGITNVLSNVWNAARSAVNYFSTYDSCEEKAEENEEESEASSEPRVTIPDDKTTENHIFRDKEGHVLDTPENRKTLEDTANDPSNYLGKDKYGNDWHAQDLEDGRQAWTESRNGRIFDGGINDTPRPWNPDTGLKQNLGG